MDMSNTIIRVEWEEESWWRGRGKVWENCTSVMSAESLIHCVETKKFPNVVSGPDVTVIVFTTSKLAAKGKSIMALTELNMLSQRFRGMPFPRSFDS